MVTKIMNWLANGETGISSDAIAFKMSGVINGRTFLTHPIDPDDFKRCLKLINLIPEIRPRLSEMREISPEWNALIEHWSDVETSFMSEVAEWLTVKYSAKSAPKTYAMMKKIYAEARIK